MVPAKIAVRIVASDAESLNTPDPEIDIEVVFDPPWSPEKASEEVRLLFEQFR